MKTTKPELEVPAGAIASLKRVARYGPYDADDECGVTRDARAIAMPVVIVMLRSQAEGLHCDRDAQLLLNLADELEAGS